MHKISLLTINHLQKKGHLIFWGTYFLFISKNTHASLLEIENLRQTYSLVQEQWPTIETIADTPAMKLSPLTLEKQNPLIVELGKKLFFDTKLSRNNTVSCASCHEPRLHFQDSRQKAIGIEGRMGTRNTLPIIGISHWDSFFWDGRAKTPEEQALMPISNPMEMDLDPEISLLRVNKDKTYVSYIEDAFQKKELSLEQMATAIVAFEKTIPAPDTIFQRFITEAQTNPKIAVKLLSDDQLMGLHLFRTKAKCMTCHNGPLLSDSNFHATGLHAYGRSLQDLGHFDFSKNPKDIGKFRTPSLLGLVQTGPWMHNGAFSNLRGIVNFYNFGGARPTPGKKLKNDPYFPKTTNLLVPLELTKEDRNHLLEFLSIL